MLKVATWNVNGVRARADQVLEWLETERPDVVCLQEVKASPEQVPAELAALPQYFGYWHGHKGYSGVALLMARETFGARPHFAHPGFDHETRIVTARAGQYLFASVYVPNGGKDFPAKVRFLDAMAEFAQHAQAEGLSLVLCGDLNVAREERDVHPSLRNPDQYGQTPAERAQLERVIGHGLVDLSRKFHPDDDRLFSWWAPWRKSRERNIGWRLDYVLAPSTLAEHALSCEVFREVGTSDHGPVIATFDITVPKLPPEPEEPEDSQPPPPTAAGPAPGSGQLPLF
ncbi:MAG: exodeoxyribonuclease III [Polyangiales bacterium]